MKPPLMHILELSARRRYLYRTKTSCIFGSHVLWSLLFTPPSTRFQNKKQRRKEKDGFSTGPVWFKIKKKKKVLHKFSLEVKGESPEFLCPLWMTLQQPWSLGRHYSQGERKKNKKTHKNTKNTFLLSSPLSPRLWCSSGTNLAFFFFLFLFVATRKWKHVRSSREKWGSLRWKERVERERGSTGAVFIQTAKPERGKWNILLMCCLQ